MALASGMVAAVAEGDAFGEQATARRTIEAPITIFFILMFLLLKVTINTPTYSSVTNIFDNPVFMNCIVGKAGRYCLWLAVHCPAGLGCFLIALLN
ncbi:hypothetical protein NIASO_18030 [Niabella soli DSM 19437]|uniref:Uncharacterized protein n=1 Tax=Niabella soli DSM 19437 TaxID=929713 RepID=W0F835_9BACT|nr:hypothetical protein NIASO_18030 [Niabella soli DSM 19437]